MAGQGAADLWMISRVGEGGSFCFSDPSSPDEAASPCGVADDLETFQSSAQLQSDCAVIPSPPPFPKDLQRLADIPAGLTSTNTHAEPAAQPIIDPGAGPTAS